MSDTESIGGAYLEGLIGGAFLAAAVVIGAWFTAFMLKRKRRFIQDAEAYLASPAELTPDRVNDIVAKASKMEARGEWQEARRLFQLVADLPDGNSSREYAAGRVELLNAKLEGQSDP